jgi:hypothetical protein
MASGARTRTKQTFLQCPCCGTVTTIHRKIGKLKELQHVKDLWCWRCKKEQKFLEVKETVFIPKWVDEFQAQFIIDDEEQEML